MRIDSLVSMLPAELVHPASVESLSGLEHYIPMGIHSMGVECRLASVESKVDLGISLTPARGARESLATLRSPRRLREASAQDSRWLGIKRLGACWRSPTFAVHRWASFLFLEYDAESAGKALPVPSVFVALDSPLGDAATRGFPELGAALEVVTALLGEAADSVGDQIVRCFRALRGQARVLHIAVMLGRPEKSVRLSVLIPRDMVDSYFGQVGTPEAAEAVRMLTTVSASGSFHQVDFDIGRPVDSRVGVNVRPQTSREWPRLLDALVGLGLSDPVKAAAVLSWPETASNSHLRNHISHIKLAGGLKQRIEAKVYLGTTGEAITRLNSISGK